MTNLYIANAELVHSVYHSKPFLVHLFGLRFSDKSRIAFYETPIETDYYLIAKRFLPSNLFAIPHKNF